VRFEQNGNFRSLRRLLPHPAQMPAKVRFKSSGGVAVTLMYSEQALEPSDTTDTRQACCGSDDSEPEADAWPADDFADSGPEEEWEG
jgi:hypothetical protein